MSKLRIGALISGGGSNLQAIISACVAGKIDGQVVFVGSDNPNAKGLEKAAKFDIPGFVVEYGHIIREWKQKPEAMILPQDADLDSLVRKQSVFRAGTDPQVIRNYLIPRVVAEACLLEKMAEYRFDLLVLAGFMRILTPYLIDHINTDPARPRIMNIHPAILPSFPGVDGYGDTYRYGCKLGGCTVHFIDYGEDSGPIIGQRSFPIEPEDTLETVKRKGLTLEWQLYPECIQLYAQNRLEVVWRETPMANGTVERRRIVTIKPE